MGYRENVWLQAQSLFDEVKQMDSSTASAFYNALTDMLWHFGQVSLACANPFHWLALFFITHKSPQKIDCSETIQISVF